MMKNVEDIAMMSTPPLPPPPLLLLLTQMLLLFGHHARPARTDTWYIGLFTGAHFPAAGEEKM